MIELNFVYSDSMDMLNIHGWLGFGPGFWKDGLDHPDNLYLCRERLVALGLISEETTTFKVVITDDPTPGFNTIRQGNGFRTARINDRVDEEEVALSVHRLIGDRPKYWKIL